MPHTMTAEERHAFLMRGTPSAILATTRADGRPHAVPVWFALDGDDILMNVGEATAKCVHMKRDPRVTLVVHDDAPPYAFVMIDGHAEVIRAADAIRSGSELIAKRYLSGPAAEGFVQYATSPGKVLVRVRATGAVGLDRIVG
jgi:PPOX class probable F420-dependent enzyme